MNAIPDIDQRWRMLLAPDAVVVSVDRRGRAVRDLRSLSPGTPVVLVGRRLRPVARRAGVRVRAEYLALPSLAAPVVISQITAPTLRWTARRVLTVPPAVTLGHAAMWRAVRLVQAAPWLLRLVPTGDRLLVGTLR
jgi:hypothetical protein